MFVQLNSIKMYYKRYGSGRPLILLHGNGEDHTIFREVIKPLSKNFTLYLPDARGHGRSSGTEEFHYVDMASICFSLSKSSGLKVRLFTASVTEGSWGFCWHPEGRDSCLI